MLEIAMVSDEERDEIQMLFERKNGLSELLKSVVDMKQQGDNIDIIYDKLVQDMGKTNLKYKLWWDKIIDKYKLQNYKISQLRIDFQSKKIIPTK